MRALLLLPLPMLLLACDSGGGKDSDVVVTDDSSAGFDVDGDGFSSDEDCDDADSTVNPAAPEVCDGRDNNCDGVTDEGGSTWFMDGDGDGFGDDANTKQSCDAPEGYSSVGGDCKDDNAEIHPDAEEICDEVDNNCDSQVDEGVTSGVWYQDADGDGYGTDDQVVTACNAPTGYAAQGGDCNDADAAYNPGAVEADCSDPNDYNCDGSVGYADADGDGFAACQECNDGDAQINPSIAELCDGVDNDCSGVIDDNAIDQQTWYADVDGDGYGDGSQALTGCSAPSGYVASGDDCNDADPAYNPGIVETDCTDPNDYNCDGSVAYSDADGDGFAACEDCDDANPAVRPDAVELCDGIDNDCSGDIDSDAVDQSSFYADADGDGYGDDGIPATACTAPAGYVSPGGDCDDQNTAYNPGAREEDCADPNDYNCDGFVGYADADGDGFAACEECDDADAAVFPGAVEICDGVDNDCSGDIDSDAVDRAIWYLDGDADGYGDVGLTTYSCNQPVSYTTDSTDCDDGSALVSPAGTELCNGVDDNCDGSIDENSASDAATWYTDADGDGFGNAGLPTVACSAPAGTVADATDCDDSRAAVSPAGTERCNGLDDNCDGSADENSAVDAATWYADTDGDGYGDAATATVSCTQPGGYLPDNTDCDDSDAAVSPADREQCNGIDDNCDGVVDENTATDAQIWYADADGDGYGDFTVDQVACYQPAGYILENSDCNDNNAAISPGDVELCNGIDDNCDRSTDEDSAADALTWYADADGDGYGDALDSTVACYLPSGYVSNTTDCDDSAAAVSPTATEICNNIDDNCDGSIDESSAADAPTWYTDRDGDGYGDASSSSRSCTQPSGTSALSTDCNDGSAAVNPGAVEVCAGVDDNCDGVIEDYTVATVFGGSLTAGSEKHYQYSPVTAGGGHLDVNWTSTGTSYEVAVGSTAGDDDVYGWTSVGNVTSTTLTGLTLSGAWTGAAYYVSVRAISGGAACTNLTTSEEIQIAEGTVWTGSVTDLRAPDAYGGYSQNWPEAGMNAVYGAHYFESIDINTGTTVLVQGFGKADAVAEGVSSAAASVTSPKDGWIALYANDIALGGSITASGRGYGGGGGGGGGSTTVSYRGRGGAAGLGGAGGLSFTAYAGAGGGGSPGGAGGVGRTTGGAGNRYGGGSGSTGCSGSNGRAGGDGTSSTIGGTGGNASSGVVGAAGVGEFSVGGGRGVSGCDNWSGGGGGGFGGGGGGGGQWASGSQDSSGGGGGGTGGAGGGDTSTGGAGAGPRGGSGGGTSSYTGIAGTVGGYAAAASNGDTSTDRNLYLGSGGGGGGGGYQETGGGGGGAGGGAIHLYAYESLVIESTATLVANGAGGGGGARDDGGASTGGAGGVGGGGGIRLEAADLVIDAVNPYISARGGGGNTTNGGTIKLFYETLSGTLPASSSAGRVYDAGVGSWDLP